MSTVLLVEDDDKIREMYARLLASEGYTTIESSNAHEANEALKELDVDLILLDIKMPQIDGTILYEVINLFHKKAKVIVSSVYPLDEQERIIPDAYDYHDKSHGIDILISKVKNALSEIRQTEKAS